ncbi:hypothetical protein C8A05DRAFT_35563 [Staphylotrichum tortipilum]|uniref:Uncharacterized protein n=1 Tax=Staphylotrichum tortipilum TaxID=2831512 RepID=A0AAN6MIK9_9PEZI|nr:hypothetical protein C8A05DRAFT_35563 [Staphylotrichum longicolle]
MCDTGTLVQSDEPPPLRLLFTNPFPTPATAEAVRQHLLTNATNPSRDPETTKALILIGARSGYIEWLKLNFPRAAGYFYYSLGPLQTDINFTFPDEETGLPVQGTIPIAQTQLHAISRFGDLYARDKDGKKLGGIVCLAMYAVAPDRGAGMCDDSAR